LFPRVLKHLVGLSLGLSQRRLAQQPVRVLLDSLAPAVDALARQRQFLGQDGGRLALADAAQQEHEQARLKVAAGEDGPAIQVVGALAFPAAVIDKATLVDAKLSRVLGGGTTAGTAQALRVEILLHPLDALLFIQQFSYREDQSRSLTCTNQLHEPRPFSPIITKDRQKLISVEIV
jgi:hypothetical protein